MNIVGIMKMVLTFFAAGIALMSANSIAQEYPSRPVRLVVPFTPGNPSDLMGRVMAQHLSTTWSQPVVIENKAGASGVIGADTVAKAPPDGYTLLMGGTGALAILPSLRKEIPYQTTRDFAPITLVAFSPTVLAVGQAVPVSTIQELIALAKAKPNQLNYATSGIGSPAHLNVEMLKKIAGIQLMHIDYKVSTAPVTDLISGEVQVMFTGISSLLPHIKSGKLKALATGGPTRSGLLPSVPTVIESGFPGFIADIWSGLLAPAKTPSAIVTRINRDAVTLIKSAEVKERFVALGADLLGDSPEQFSRYIVAEIDKWARVIKDANIPRE